MHRNIGLLVVGSSLLVALPLAAWLSQLDRHQQPPGPATGVLYRDLGQDEVPIDPETALATIHDLRAQFGSVLEDSLLGEANPGAAKRAGSPESFDDFLRAEVVAESPPQFKTMVPPKTVVPPDSPSSETAVPVDHRSEADALAVTLRSAANQLAERAEQASSHGDDTQYLRLAALANLLRAEAATMAVEQDPTSGPD